jgi:flagellar hook-length control protein FliK
MPAAQPLPASASAPSPNAGARRAENAGAPPQAAGVFAAALHSATQPPPEARRAEPPRHGDAPPAAREAPPPAHGTPSPGDAAPPQAEPPAAPPDADDSNSMNPPSNKLARPMRWTHTLPPQSVVEAPAVPAGTPPHDTPAPTIVAIAPLPDEKPPPAQGIETPPMAPAPFELTPTSAAPAPTPPPPALSSQPHLSEGKTQPRQTLPAPDPSVMQPIDTAPRAVAPPLPERVTLPVRPGAPTMAKDDLLRGDVTPGTEVAPSPSQWPITTPPRESLVLPPTPAETLPPRAEAPPLASAPTANAAIALPSPLAGALPPSLSVPASPPLALNQPAFADELGAQVAMWTRQGVQQAELRLNPAEMGPVQVRIRLDGEQAQVQFVADAAATRDALQAALPELRLALADEGLQLTGADVRSDARADTRADSGPGQRHGGPPHQGNRRLGAGGGEGDEPWPAAGPRPTGRRGLLDLYA